MELKKFLEEQKSKCNHRLDEIKEEVEEIKEKNDKSEDEAELKAFGESLAELEAEKAELEAELKEIDAQIAALDKEDPKDNPANPERAKFLVFGNQEVRGGQKPMTIEERTKQAEEFRKSGYKKIEARAILSSSNIAKPTEVHGIKDVFDYVSSIADLVLYQDCSGMGSNRVAYEDTTGAAAEHTEGQAISSTDPTFNYVDITPEKNFGTYTEISRELKNVSPLDYEGRVVDLSEKNLKKKVAALVTAKIVASSLNEELEITELNESTLRNIAFSYGGDEGIVGNSWLFLNKKTLVAFGDIVSSLTKQDVYEITPDVNNPNTGIIKKGGLSVKYCLNSYLPAFDEAEEDDVVMFYGQPKEAAEVDFFGDYEIRVSEEAGDVFKKNMIAVRGTCQVGAGVVKKYGFVAVKKATAAAANTGSGNTGSGQ